MTLFGAVEVRQLCVRAATAMPALKDGINAADAKLGDGDTGTMLLRVLQAMHADAIDDSDDVGVVLLKMARSAASATGSSLGTLLATALLTVGKATTGRRQVPVEELGHLLSNATQAMMHRGGARLGDKTIVDAVDAVATAIAGLKESGAVASRANEAVRAALADYRTRLNRIGRARMFGESSIGLDDPGMFAFAQLLHAMTRDGPAADR